MVEPNGSITTIANTDSSDTSYDPGSEGNAIVSSDGAMFIQAGPRIFVVGPSDGVQAFAGNGRTGVPIDGSRAVDSPLPMEIWGLAIDLVGNLYVADGATSVWKIDTEGVITRFAGRL